ncbi:MAG: homogentisate 1,2-dioxygenase [Gammaproteobacteria bacterium]|nr:homogentisate 1,2-dioxygenase [Gammaproteobacteria bacterium]
MATVISTATSSGAVAAPATAASHEYLGGFGNELESEALAGALPQGRFSPQQVAYGLYAEKFSSTAFTAPRESNRRTWFYRIRPSVTQGDFRPLAHARICNGPITEVATPPNQMRWDPLPIADAPADFIDGLVTFAANGNAAMHTGCGIHYYLANRSMRDRYFYNADGELLIVPQQGRLDIHTECGRLDVAPGEIALIPRGMKFSVALPDGPSRGYICENYGAHFRLPERGPVGSDGFANDRDFKAPVAAYEDKQGEFELVCKFAGRLYVCALDHSPLDVVAWVGNSLPYKYNLELFNVINTVSYDHPDPSIFTVMTAPSDTPGTANVDFVIFPPRWMVGEDTFRAPWYHRNVMSEFMGLIYGVYDAKPEGFVPGGASLHNCMAAHGPDEAAYNGSANTKLVPVKQTDTMAFMFESRYVMQPTRFALESAQRQKNYIDCWQQLKRHFNP